MKSYKKACVKIVEKERQNMFVKFLIRGRQYVYKVHNKGTT